MPTGYGDIFDTAYKYLASQSWALLSPAHKPEEVMEKLKTTMREILVGSLEFEAENRRHQEKPSFALSVVSLEKVSENPNLREYYVRVDDKGQLATVDGYEDGSFVDLFEMREYKPSRVHAAAKKKADAEGTEELQTGKEVPLHGGSHEHAVLWFAKRAHQRMRPLRRGRPHGFPRFK